MPVSRTRAALVAFAVTALACAWYVWGSSRAGYVADYDQIWQMARLLWAGSDPYAVALAAPVTAQNPTPMGFFYPLPAVVAAAPLALLPLRIARLVWVGGGVFGFTYLILRRHGYHAIPAVMSGAFLMAVSLGQWSLWLACAVMAPAFGWFVGGKPNVGAATVAGARRPVWVAGVALIPVVISFLWWPTWPSGWLTTVQTFHSPPYVLRPGGILLLLALARWRRPEARWLAVMACVPATPGPADAMALWAFPMSFRQSLALALLTHAPNFLMIGAHFSTFAAYTERGAAWCLWVIYVPVLVAVLLRPNEGTVPAWLSRVRGTPNVLTP